MIECKCYLPCGLCDLSHERCKQCDTPSSIDKPCEHEWYTQQRNLRFNDQAIEFVTRYKCIKCGKEMWDTKSLIHDEDEEEIQ